MNDPGNFLTRWSRRKRGAADESGQSPGDEQEQGAPDAPRAERAADAAPPQTQAEDSGTTEPVFDLSKLPSLESITAETDIRAFLAPGVPAELKLAALRRAWVADPKVRDFVGLNDYDWDFHTPGAIPGFGPLEMTDELRREVIRIVSGWQAEPEPAVPTTPATAPAAEPDVSPAQPTAAIEEINAQPSALTPAASENSNPAPDHSVRNPDEPIPAEATTQRNKDSAASQQEHSRSENLQTLARRGHGRALPK